MKRLIVALLVGGAVFGTVFAVAATLDVTGGTLQMSSAVDAECDDDGVTLNYTFGPEGGADADPLTDDDQVLTAEVEGIAAACGAAGASVTVELFGADGDLCDSAEAVIPGGGGDVILAL